MNESLSVYPETVDYSQEIQTIIDNQQNYLDYQSLIVHNQEVIINKQEIVYKSINQSIFIVMLLIIVIIGYRVGVDFLKGVFKNV